jgi:hypothetical protein
MGFPAENFFFESGIRHPDLKSPASATPEVMRNIQNDSVNYIQFLFRQTTIKSDLGF